MWDATFYSGCVPHWYWLLLGEFPCQESFDSLSGRSCFLAGEFHEQENPCTDDESENENVVKVGEDEVEGEDSNCPEDNPSEEFLDGVHWFTFRWWLMVFTLHDFGGKGNLVWFYCSCGLRVRVERGYNGGMTNTSVEIACLALLQKE